MYRIVACDLDETLLDDSHLIPRRVREAIAAARGRGCRFVPATGRPYDSVADVLGALGVAGAEGEYVISFNGGALYENSRPEPLSTSALPRAQAEALYARGVELGMCMHVYTPDVVWLYDYVASERAYIEGRMNIRETNSTTLGGCVGEAPVVKLIYRDLDLGRLRRVEREVAADGLSAGLAVYYSSGRYLEFNAPGVDKGAGLAHLAAHLGVDMAQTVAIGDSSNDIPMLRAAGLGVAVANASPETRAAADYVCEATNDEGAVAEVIERFVLA